MGPMTLTRFSNRPPGSHFATQRPPIWSPQTSQGSPTAPRTPLCSPNPLQDNQFEATRISKGAGGRGVSLKIRRGALHLLACRVTARRRLLNYLQSYLLNYLQSYLLPLPPQGLVSEDLGRMFKKPTVFHHSGAPNVISPSPQRVPASAAGDPPPGAQNPLKSSKNVMCLQVLFLVVCLCLFGTFLVPKWSPKCVQKGKKNRARFSIYV